jgi:hypothetical protein
MRTFLKDLITTGFKDNLKAIQNAENFFKHTGYIKDENELKRVFLESDSKGIHDLLHQHTVRNRLQSIEKAVNLIKNIAVFFLVLTILSIVLYAISIN